MKVKVKKRIKTYEVTSYLGDVIAVFIDEEKAWDYIDYLAVLNGDKIYDYYTVDTTMEEQNVI